MKRIAALLLALIFALALVGCNVDEGKPVDRSPTPAAEGTSTPSLDGTPDLSELGTTVLIIDGDEVSLAELRYQAASLMSMYEFYGDGAVDWDEEIDGMAARDFFISEAVNTCKLFRAVERYAADNGYGLSDEERAEIDADLAEYIASAGGDEAFDSQIMAAGMTREMYEYIVYVPELYYHVFETIFGDDGPRALSEADVLGYFAENYITTRHILKIALDEEGGYLSESETEAVRAQAQSIRDLLASGADFAAVAEAETDDDSLGANRLTASVETMPDEYVAAAQSLANGELSEVVDIDGAFVVILKEQLDASYLDENYDEIKEECGLKLFREILDPVRDSLTVERTDAFDRLVDVDEIYRAFFG